MRFAVYHHKLVYDGNKIIVRDLIVLKAGRQIVGWTDFHKYVRGGGIRSIASEKTVAFSQVVQFLNYIFFDKYHVQKLVEVEPHMVKDFACDYGLHHLVGDNEQTHRLKSTVELCVWNVVHFLEEVIRENADCKMKVSDFYKKVEQYSKSDRRYVTKKKLAFDIVYMEDSYATLRNLPESAFRMIFNRILTHHTNILMLAALGSFAGLRPSEACNVRRADSPLGPGLRFEILDGKVYNIIIDLDSEYCLRSDTVDVGGVKKSRNQRVYVDFIPVFVDCYERYMRYIEGKKYEAAYGPLTTNRTGKAYTYASYLAEFHQVVEECIPDMLDSDDPELVNYGHNLMENRISPHIFRHWFSCKLALLGVDAYELMYWRGDKAIESAATYINNKSDLEKQYQKVNNEVFDYARWLAEKKYGD